MHNLSGLDVKIERVRSGVKQYRLAAALGIPQSTLSKIEGGQQIVPRARLEEIVRVIRELAGEPAGVRDVA